MRPSMMHRESTVERSALPKARVEHLVRIYHSATDAGKAVGMRREAVHNAAKRYGLKFRLVYSMAEDAASDNKYLT